jgi:hypothetical protein
MNREHMDMTPNYEAIPLKERMQFQHELISEMLPKDFRDQGHERQIMLELDWANIYAKKVSDIINNEYKKACDIVIAMLNESKSSN